VEAVVLEADGSLIVIASGSDSQDLLDHVRGADEARRG
jgi:hypothetical protein